MAIAALNSSELVSLMVAGGGVAITGFWLMLREGPAGEAAKISLGSMQVSSSTAGFAVFFSGLAAFSAPVVAPVSTRAFMNTIIPASFGPGEESVGDSPAFVQASGHISAQPTQPNTNISNAMIVEPGKLVGGTHARDQSDWYLFDTRSVTDPQIEIEISERNRGCHAHFYDDQQKYLGLVSLTRGRNALNLDVKGNEGFYVQLACVQNATTQSYTVTFNPVQN
jgi:hypothetical protein